jgi:hypothetical protein
MHRSDRPGSRERKQERIRTREEMMYTKLKWLCAVPATMMLGSPLAQQTSIQDLLKCAVQRISPALKSGSTAIAATPGSAGTSTTEGTLQIVDGSVFPFTVAGVQAALDEVEATGGGTVLIPANANVLITNASIKIGNRVKLVGLGDHHSVPTFTANATTNVSAMIENKAQDGSQQFAYIEGIQVYGNRGSGAVVRKGIYFNEVYLGSAIRDVLVWKVSGSGIVLDGVTNGNGLGPMVLDNVTVTHSGANNILLTGGCEGVLMNMVACENVDTGGAQIQITSAGSVTPSQGHTLNAVHFEGLNAATGLWLNGASAVQVNGLLQYSAVAANAVKITGSAAGSDGAFAAGGHVLQNIEGNIATIIDDQVAGVTVGNAEGRFVRYYFSPVSSTTLDNAQVVGLQLQRRGADQASAATISPSDGNFFIVTGTTSIKKITNSMRYSGKILTLRSTGALTIAHKAGGTGNIRCSASVDLRMAADSRVQFISDGTLWWQLTPVVNP